LDSGFEVLKMFEASGGPKIGGNVRTDVANTFTGNVAMASLLSAIPATVQDIAVGGTITVPTNTFNKRLTAAADVPATGAILAAGTVDGQILNLFNVDTTDSITFAASATSNVADGANDVIQPLSMISLVWDSTSSLWYTGENDPVAPYATYSHSVTLTVPVVANANPVPFDTVDAEAGSFNQATSTITVTIATPGVVTWTAHGLKIGDTIVFSTTGALPTGIVAGTTYYVSTTGLAANTFSISTTLANAIAGTNVATTGTQSGVHTANALNVIVVPTAGDYTLAFSAIMDLAGGAAANGYIWLNVNGTDVPRSNTDVTLAAAAHSVVSVTVTYAFAKNDKFRLYFGGSDTDVEMVATAAAASPTRPASPAIILSIVKVGR